LISGFSGSKDTSFISFSRDSETSRADIFNCYDCWDFAAGFMEEV
jgi:hypothetical protein